MCSLLRFASILPAFVATAAAAETPQSLWLQVPPPPAVAETAQCDAGMAVLGEIEQAAADSLLAAQAMMSQAAPTTAVSDDQGAVLDRMMEPSLQECATAAELEAGQLADEADQKFAVAVAELEARRSAALDNCGNEQTPGYDACRARTMDEYEALGREEANRQLRSLSVAFAEWRDRTAQCLERREAAVAAFDAAGISGPFASLGANMRTISWNLVHLHAGASNRLCERAYEAGHALDAPY